MLVTMVFRSATMVLTASGRAMEAGSTGDFISVRNTQTNTNVDARILGPNRVEVAALRQLAASEGKVQ
jgi:flagella basal body P-ring formation protein FlgA